MRIMNIFVICLFLAAAGCSSDRKTVYRSTDAGGTAVTSTTAPVTTTASPSTTVVREETTVRDSHPSVLGSAWNFIGEVLAFPFHLIGYIFQGIF